MVCPEEPPYKVPHHCQFQSIKGLPQLELLEKELAKKGLKDPWMRNEMWRHHPGFGTKMKRGLTFFFRGAPLGLALTIVTVAAEKLLGGDQHGHGHGHGEHKD